MRLNQLSRRDFVRLSAAGAAATPFVLEPGVMNAAAPTAQDIVDRIKKNLGLEWNASTVDTFKAGDPATVVSGVVTTSLATLDVMRRAVTSGANLIVTSGPTFYSRTDSPTPPAGRGRGATPPPSMSDPLFTAKNEFIRNNKLVVWRFSDHWRPPGSHRFTVPETTLGTLAAAVQKRLGARAIRVVGDPNARVRRIQLGVGYATPAVNSTDIDVVISGEQQEVDGFLDSPEYVLDAAALGIAKGWIMLGHAVSEEAGMLEMAQWIKTFIPEVPVQLVKAGEPFWAP